MGATGYCRLCRSGLVGTINNMLESGSTDLEVKEFAWAHGLHSSASSVHTHRAHIVSGGYAVEEATGVDVVPTPCGALEAAMPEASLVSTQPGALAGVGGDQGAAMHGDGAIRWALESVIAECIKRMNAGTLALTGRDLVSALTLYGVRYGAQKDDRLANLLTDMGISVNVSVIVKEQGRVDSTQEG
jgi:hypothetical protein